MSGTDPLPNIAFTGKAGSGKTTAAEFLAEGGWYRLSIASPLKTMAASVIDGGEKNRGLLQELGQLIRHYDEDAWVKLMLRQIDTARSMGQGQRFVIDDLRFPNEWWKLREAGFVIVRVTAPKWLRVDRLRRNGKLQDEAQLDDISETALDSFDADYEIENAELPHELYQQIRRLVFKERARV